ncbi:MAG: malonyl-CoA synthase [Betaproteobacteria bacterium]|nr:malonyl-CoA synthase [Betaproteobacteria bacterium]
MNFNFYALIESRMPKERNAPLLETESGETFSYADLDRATARYAAFLTGLGLNKGDRVAAQVDKSPQALFLYLGCLRAGLCYLPLNTAYQKGEVGYFLQDAEPGAVVCRPAAEAWIRDLAREAGVPHVFTLDEEGRGSFADAAAGSPAVFATAVLAPDDLASIIYTSGTTGRSKGAMVTHKNLASNGEVLRQYWGFSAADVLFHALPLFHVHGLFVACHCVLLSGARMVFHRKFDPAAALTALPRCTVMMGVPTFYVRLLEAPGLTQEACRSMRLFISGSAPLLKDTFDAWRERTGQVILERYGMSEAGMITSNPLTGERRGGTVGFPLPGVSVRVADDADRPLPAEETGGVQIRGDNLFAGYWRLPEKTNEEFTADGWFRTGDVGSFDAGGYVHIVGRAKDLVISGGFNVYPKEIELVIDTLPGVVESAVIGVPHPDFGEAVTAVVVKDAKAELTEDAVIAHVKSQLANFKVPKRVYFVNDLPRNTMGKVQKNILRDTYSKQG